MRGPPVRGAAGPNDPALTWARQELAARALGRVASALAGIPLAPVKGVALGRWLYDDPAERPLVDVDVLVRRTDLPEAERRLAAAGLFPWYRSAELGETCVHVDRFPVELHAEIARPSLTGLTADELIARASEDTSTFGFPVLRLDDVDHFLLVAANAVHDSFVRANAHIPNDLERLLARIGTRGAGEAVGRADAAGFSTGLRNTAVWMAEAHGSQVFAAFAGRMGPARRPAHARATRLLWRAGAGGRLALAVACFTNDRAAVRARGLFGVVRRGVMRAARLDPG